MIVLRCWQSRRLYTVLRLVMLLLGAVCLAQMPVGAQGSNTVYLPTIIRGRDPILTRPEPFGIETASNSITFARVSQPADELNATWIRLNTVSWREVQPTPDLPVANWNWQSESLVTFERELTAATQLRMLPMVIVDDYPRWATLHETSCSALHADHFQDFARFMQELVRRYSQAPYNVRHWELGNEVDVDHRLVPQDNFYGCWGVKEDPYYGGEHYGRMLNVVTPAIKQVDPTAQVLIGGLLLDSPVTTNPDLGRPELFFEGILRAGAGANFDFVPFHAYPPYQGRTFDSDRQDERWASRGGMLAGKTRFLRDTMARYGIDKPVMLNEASLLYYGDVNNLPDDFLQAQADHLVRLFARGMAADLKAIVWFTLNGPGWRAGSLLGRQQVPRPVFATYQQLIGQARQAIDTRDVSAEYGTGIEAYRFRKFSRYVDVLWSPDGTTRQVRVPIVKFIRALSRDGVRLTPVSQTSDTVVLEVGIEPIYIQRL